MSHIAVRLLPRAFYTSTNIFSTSKYNKLFHRSIMNPSSSTTTTTPIDDKNVITLIKQDHREVSRKNQEYLNTADKDLRFKLGKEIIKLLSVHSVCEEQSVYPAYGRLLGKDGEDIAKQSINEHQELKETLYKLDQLDKNDPAFDPTLTKVMSLMEEHALVHEEQDFLIRLEKMASKDELDRLGEQFLEAKKLAPTRPHPSASYNPTIQKVQAALSTPLDALKDKVEGV